MALCCIRCGATATAGINQVNKSPENWTVLTSQIVSEPKLVILLTPAGVVFREKSHMLGAKSAAVRLRGAGNTTAIVPTYQGLITEYRIGPPMQT